MARQGKKRITLDIPESVYEVIVEMCKKRHMKITPYIIMTIIDFLRKESEWDGEKYV